MIKFLIKIIMHFSVEYTYKVYIHIERIVHAFASQILK